MREILHIFKYTHLHKFFLKSCVVKFLAFPRSFVFLSTGINICFVLSLYLDKCVFVYFVMREFRTQRQQSLYMKAIISFGENFSKKWAMGFRVGGIEITERASRVYQGRVKTTLGYLNLVVTSLILFSKQDKNLPTLTPDLILLPCSFKFGPPVHNIPLIRLIFL